MSAGASRDEVVMLPGRVDGSAPAAGRGIRAAWTEAGLAVAAFAALCGGVLSSKQLGRLADHRRDHRGARTRAAQDEPGSETDGVPGRSGQVPGNGPRL